MSDKFWIYENWKTNGHRARMHKATCKFCATEGEVPRQSMEGSAWRGPFNTLEEANRYALELGAKVSCCKRCIKDLGIGEKIIDN